MRCTPVHATGEATDTQPPYPTPCRCGQRAGCRSAGHTRSCRPPCRAAQPRGGRPPLKREGMSLIEVLVAMTITLILIFAMVQLFQSMGDTMTLSRAALERNGQMRNALDRFSNDIDLLTVPTQPPVDYSAGLGYLEIIEGRVFDKSAALPAAANETIIGDYDDLIMFTATSRGQPFIGRYMGSVIESQDAEIIWWTVLDDLNQNGTREQGEYFTLYRRVLLILPALNVNGSNTGNAVANEAALTTFQQQNDVSVRMEGGMAVANSLADLSFRCNRFAHVQGAANYPNPINAALNSNRLLPLSGPRLGEDVVLTNVLSFDLRLYDPRAPFRSNVAGPNGIALQPTDPGWSGAAVVAGYGAYVDLAYTGTTLSHFSHVPYANQPGRPFLLSCFTDGRPSAVYDTWTNAYERDSLNQDGDATVDEGTDGLDNDGIYGVDGASELEAPPPYDQPLRGMRLILRSTDIPTRQVMQSSISVDFSTD